jgi:LCP family protein required for cell wall assembly
MNDWSHRWADGNRHGGEVEPARVITGQVWSQSTHPPETRPAPPPHGAAPNHPRIPHQRDNPSGDGGAGARTPRGRTLKARPSRSRRITRIVILTVFALLATSVGTYVWADSELNRAVDLGKVEDRAPLGKGTNYLIVGSDSRAGLSDEAKRDLHTGSADGGRTDSMILLHTGTHGTTMMSLPRDSWVTIPSFIRPETGKHYRTSRNKLNAAYSLGGPELLVRTIERNTGLHVDHYAEIGFAGFVGVVDAVGGVEMCLDREIKDDKSGADLKKGCHNLDGSKALAFVRQRHQEAQGDLGRTKNQQKFLAALAQKAATPGVALNPFKAFPTLSAGLETLFVDTDMDPRELTSLFRAMKGVTAGDGKRINVPVSDPSLQTSKGSAVKWDATQAERLFAELRKDQHVSVEEGN